MDINEIIRQLKKTKTDLEGMKPTDPVVEAFDQTCEKLDAQLRSIASFAGRKQIGLDEDWTYAKPFGFIFRGNPHAWAQDLIKVYTGFAIALREVNPVLFATLPQCKEFTSKQGEVYITGDNSKLRKSKTLSDGIFFETNLNAELIRKNIINLLKIYEIDHSEVQFFLIR